MENRKAVWYSIIRYSPKNISGEIINVGLIVHGIEGDYTLKCFLLDESSYKIRSISENNTEINIYKNYKEVLEYYISNCKNDLSGTVGSVQISSCYKENFLDNLYKHYIHEKLTLTKPNFAFTENIDMLFNSLARAYIGERYLKKEPKILTAKSRIKNIFEERNLIGRKIKTDIEFKPIISLDDLRVKVDFGFKNGVWNYMEAIPILSTPSEISEWFAKTKFTIETLKSKHENANIQLVYKSSDSKNDIISMFDYLIEENKGVSRLNIDDSNRIDELCDYIEKEAEDIEGYIAS